MNACYKKYSVFVCRVYKGYVWAYNDSDARRLAGKMFPDFKEVITVKLV